MVVEVLLYQQAYLKNQKPHELAKNRGLRIKLIVLIDRKINVRTRLVFIILRPFSILCFCNVKIKLKSK